MDGPKWAMLFLSSDLVGEAVHRPLVFFEECRAKPGANEYSIRHHKCLSGPVLAVGPSRVETDLLVCDFPSPPERPVTAG
jgi:hypothetical protein